MPATLTEKPVNARIPLDIATEIDALTKATGRTRSFLMVEALREYLQGQAWQVRDIKDALAEANIGEFATENEVATFLRNLAVKWPRVALENMATIASCIAQDSPARANTRHFSFRSRASREDARLSWLFRRRHSGARRRNSRTCGAQKLPRDVQGEENKRRNHPGSPHEAKTPQKVQ